MVLIPGGEFTMGTNDGFPYEGPAHRVAVESFWMDAHEITVSEFARFVAATGYTTEAERYGEAGVFDPEAPGWKNEIGASWRHPNGFGPDPPPDQPVVQVSWGDAATYARWLNKRLPTEAEWEYAARGGLSMKTYAWGNELRPRGRCVANWWQGSFPESNTAEDGYRGLAEAGRFPPNGYGLFDMAGNAWEWCADWFDEAYYGRSEAANPAGPADGNERVIRGGSWLCSENYCRGYRVAARSHATPDSALNNLGFRCVRSR